MDRLPVELKLTLFYALSDVDTLIALSHTSSSFYKGFKESQSLIVATVLSKEIHPDVLPSAVAVWEASRIKPWSKSRVQRFLETYSDSVAPPSRSTWTLSEASEISSLYGHVQYFAADFCASILPVHPISGAQDAIYSPPSLSETCRIECTLYRFELYCTLFRRQSMRQKDDDRFSIAEQQSLYFEKFKPWQNEQLACIHDYLYKKLSVPYDEMAEHDVVWGERGPDIDVAESSCSSRKEGHLSRGLEFLRKLSSAKSYEEINALFGHETCANYQFLDAGLVGEEDFSERDFSEQGNQVAQLLDTSVDSADNDSGPMEAWSWAEGSDCYYESDRMHLRDWGYCLWDKSRLIAWDVFREEWYTDHLSRRERRKEETRQRKERISKSNKERSRIWNLGGEGWWAEGDESKIIWPAPQKPKPDSRGCRLHTQGNRWCPDDCIVRLYDLKRAGDETVSMSIYD